MERLHIPTDYGPGWRERLMAFLHQNKDMRITIDVVAYDPVCERCGKEIPVGRETNYGGYTMCPACSSFEEEVDDECA
jgi:RNA polymerase-binding transcription factor DksA